MCVLLLAAVIVLGVHIHTKNTNYTEERVRLLTRNTNLTEERDQLLTTIKALKDQLAINNQDFTAEKKELLSKNDNLMKQSQQLNQENNDLRKRLGEMELIVELFLFTDQSCLYYFSSEKKSWTESRKYCRERGADLIIINNREEQVSERYCVFWIGLTDSDEEGTWKWVDGSILTSGFWMFGEPSGHRRENCALTVVGEWADHPCTEEYNWVCEKRKTVHGAYKPPPICLVWQCLYDYLKYTYEREFKCRNHDHIYTNIQH
uniref:C-type lectin domain-containing protein n=1 Tax=Sinocyclocheilus rhinocerous TaxID=307959 RepID=A0A673HMF3_9TELE